MYCLNQVAFLHAFLSRWLSIGSRLTIDDKISLVSALTVEFVFFPAHNSSVPCFKLSPLRVSEIPQGAEKRAPWRCVEKLLHDLRFLGVS